jgi:hypothetical protein
MGRRLLRITKNLRSRLIAASLVLAATLTLAGLLAATLTRTAPAWWRQYRPTPELRTLASDVENAAISTLYRQRPPDPAAQPASAPWSVAVRDQDASAWLIARLPEWMNGNADLPDWPDSLGQPQIRFEPGLVRVGVLFRRENGDRVLTASVRPVLAPDGSLWLRTAWIHIGRLPVPAALILRNAERQLLPYLPGDLADERSAASLLAILRGDAPLARTPALRLEDGRAVHLLGLRVLEGRVEFDCRTDLSGSAQPARSRLPSGHAED